MDPPLCSLLAKPPLHITIWVWWWNSVRRKREQEPPIENGVMEDTSFERQKSGVRLRPVWGTSKKKGLNKEIPEGQIWQRSKLGRFWTSRWFCLWKVNSYIGMMEERTRQLCGRERRNRICGHGWFLRGRADNEKKGGVLFFLLFLSCWGVNPGSCAC